MKPIQRVAQIIKDKELSVRDFERQIGSKEGTMEKAFKRNSTLKDEVLIKILELFPEINCEWLLTGKGQKYNKSTDSSEESTDTEESGIRFEKTVAIEVLKILKPYLAESKKIQQNNSTWIHELENIQKMIAIKIDTIERTTKNTYNMFKK